MPDRIQNIDTTKAVVYSSDIGGGYYQVDSVADRDAISLDRRRVGMAVTYSQVAGFVTERFEGSDTLDVTWENQSNWVEIRAGDQDSISTSYSLDSLMKYNNTTLFIEHDAVNFNNLYTFPLADGANGQAMTTNGSGVLSFGDVGDVTKVGTPVDNQVGIWTGDGTLESSDCITYNSSTAILTLKGRKFPGAGSIVLDSQNGVSIYKSGFIYKLPTADGTNGQSITTNGSGTLSFGDVGVYNNVHFVEEGDDIKVASTDVGDLIVIYPGTYTVTGNLNTYTGRKFYAYPGVTINCSSSLYEMNGYLDIYWYGYADFVSNTTLINMSSTVGGNMYFECNDVEVTTETDAIYVSSFNEAIVKVHKDISSLNNYGGVDLEANTIEFRCENLYGHLSYQNATKPIISEGNIINGRSDAYGLNVSTVPALTHTGFIDGGTGNGVFLSNVKAIINGDIECINSKQAVLTSGTTSLKAKDVEGGEISNTNATLVINNSTNNIFEQNETTSKIFVKKATNPTFTGYAGSVSSVVFEEELTLGSSDIDVFGRVTIKGEYKNPNGKTIRATQASRLILDNIYGDLFTLDTLFSVETLGYLIVKSVSINNDKNGIVINLDNFAKFYYYGTSLIEAPFPINTEASATINPFNIGNIYIDNPVTIGSGSTLNNYINNTGGNIHLQNSLENY